MKLTITKIDADNLVLMIQKEKRHINELKGEVNETDRIHALIYLDELERKFKK